MAEISPGAREIDYERTKPGKEHEPRSDWRSSRGRAEEVGGCAAAWLLGASIPWFVGSAPGAEPEAH